jgi:hypothetical protein
LPAVPFALTLEGVLTAGSATIAVVVSLAVGWYGHRWRYAEQDKQGAQARLRGATTAAWRARRLILVAGFIAFAAADVWIRHHSR